MRDLAALGYDAEWEVLPAAALGAPHHRERVFIVAYPHSQRADGRARLLAPLERIMGEHQQSVRVSDWLGIRFDRARKASAREAYRGPVVHRVDDGSAERLDRPGGVKTASRVSWYRSGRSASRPSATALPHSNHTPIAACILEAEELPAAPTPPSSGGWGSE